MKANAALYSHAELTAMNTELENEMKDQGIARYLAITKAAKQGKKGGATRMESQTSYGHSLLSEIIDPMARGLKNLIALSKGKPGKSPVAMYKLAAMDAHVTCYLAAKTILDNLSVGVKFTHLAMQIAQKITDEDYLKMLESHNAKWFSKIEGSLKKAGTVDYNHKINVFKNMGKKAGINKDKLGYDTMAKMGHALISMFEMHTGLICIDTVWEHSKKGKRTACKMVYPTAKATAFIAKNMQAVQALTPDCGPVCIPPRLWSTPFNGGYHSPELRRLNPLVRTRNKAQVQTMARQKRFDYDALNGLVQSAWRINNGVLDVLKADFKAQAAGSSLPDTTPFTGIPCPLNPPRRDHSKAAKQAFKQWWLTLQAAEQKEYTDWKEANRQGYRNDKKRFSQLKQLSTIIRQAQRYKHFEEFWFNWFLDSRGRAYVIGTLSPQGVDTAKGVIQPAELVPLFSHGYKWVKLQLTGVYGYDKETIKDRLNWVNKRHDMILNAANAPLESGYQFWNSAEKPYQFLAACIEYRNVHTQLAMGVPVEHCKCRLNVAQDGKCNGIQHFSAMILDEQGGKDVCLTQDAPGGLPADVYTKVARGTCDALSVVQPKHFDMASILVALGLTRKSAKGQTMIVPYGGTIQGCKEASIKWLDERYSQLGGSYEDVLLIKKIGKFQDSIQASRKSELGQVSLEQTLNEIGNYLGKVVWKVLLKVLRRTIQVMLFEKRCARAVASGSADDNLGQVISWLTLNGFFVTEDYKETSEQTVASRMCGRIDMYLQVPTCMIRTAKMITSVAPNMVHSLDAAHMFLTIAKCMKVHGINFFACIHDSFGTHAGYSQSLADTLRETFVYMYKVKQPLRRWYRELARQWAGIKNPKVDSFPEWSEIEKITGTLEISDVLDSEFFFL